MVQNKTLLDGRVAIVTGAGRGLGKAIAIALADAGACVTLTARTEAEIVQVAKEIEAHGHRALPVTADISKSVDVNKVVQETVAAFGRVDVLVNNAALVEKAASIEATFDQWQKVIDVNLTGAFLCSQAVAKVMAAQGGGSIVNINSVAAHIGPPALASYAASKAGVHGLMRVLAVEWGKYNIRINSISPGGLDTEMGEKLRALDPEAWDRRIRRIPLGRQVSLKDVSNAVLFFAGEESAMITGRDIIIDGGLLVCNPGNVE